MRIVFLLLVLANLVFYAYAFVARERGMGESAGPELQINADKVRLIKDTAAAKGSPASGAAACLEWGVIAASDLARADAALAQLELPAGSLQRVAVDAAGFWVHIPPLKNKAEVDKKAAELKKLGIADFSPVQDASLGRNAISLGVFSTEEAAQGRLAALKEKGVRSAKVESREGIIKQMRYFMREPDGSVVAKIAGLQQAFPGTQMKAGPCPAPELARN